MLFKKEIFIEITPSVLTLPEARKKVVELLINNSTEETVSAFEDAKSGVPGSLEQCLQIIQDTLM